MEAFACVRPEHLNQHGFLFGGQLLLWADEYAWMAATRAYPGCKFVTVAFDRSEFRKPAPLGAILRFVMTQTRRGTTSVAFSVAIHATPPGACRESLVFNAAVTLVRVDEQGRKVPLPADTTPPAF